MPILTASGSIANFDTDLSLPYQSIVSEIVASGGGGTTQSPVDIVGYSSASITKSDEDMTAKEVITIQLGQTIYGGQLVLTRKNTGGYSVKLVKTWNIVDLGSLSWGVYSSNYFYTTINDLKLPVTTSDRVKGLLCSCYIPSTSGSLSSMPDKSFLKFNQAENFWIYDTDYSDKNVFKTAMSGQQLAYELATPVEIDLTDIPDINALIGTNNVFNDTNGNVTVEYKESINKAINDLLNTNRSLSMMRTLETDETLERGETDER